MKKIFLLPFLFWLCIQNFTAQTSTEQFETESANSTSFTDNGVIFNIISHVGNFHISNFTGTGWNGTANDNRYIDNSGNGNMVSGASFSIKTTSNLFKVNKFWMYLSDQSVLNQNVTGTITVTGRLSGVAKFSITKTNGFVTSLGTTNGFTLIDMTILNGQSSLKTIV